MDFTKMFSMGGGGGGGGKSESSSASSTSGNNFSGDGGVSSPIGYIVLGVLALVVFVGLILVVKK